MREGQDEDVHPRFLVDHVVRETRTEAFSDSWATNTHASGCPNQWRAVQRRTSKPSRRDVAPPSDGVARPPRLRSAIPPGKSGPRARSTRFRLPKTINQLPNTDPAQGGGFWGDPEWRDLTRPLRSSHRKPERLFDWNGLDQALAMGFGP